MDMNRRCLIKCLAGGAASAAASGGAAASARAKPSGEQPAGGARALSSAERDGLVREWWETSVLDATGKYVFDEEVKAVNAMMVGVDEYPEWAVQVRGAMPKYGFEMCSHRWLDGLDNAMGMVGSEQYRPSGAGRCGDVPGAAVDAAVRKALAVQQWVRGVAPDDGLGRQVAAWLGEPTAEKREAATSFAELVLAHLLKSDQVAAAAAAEWQARAERNGIVKAMYEGEGLPHFLRCACGFKTVDRLDVYVRMIGGDLSEAGQRHGICNQQLRFVFRDDPARFDVTRGYLWGLDAYLMGRDEKWLLASKPDCAGAAIYALQAVSSPGPPTPLRRWLVASLLKSTKIWCQRTIEVTGEDAVPAYARDLPDVVAAARAEPLKVSRELIDTVGYCGLVCGVCENRCPCKLSPEVGDANCYQRTCCQEKGLDGCWECEQFPCDNGYFARDNETWRGLCIAATQCAREQGLEDYVRMIVTRFGLTAEYGDITHKTPEEALRILRGVGG